MPAKDTCVRFDGQAILVTGAGRGLGKALALLLAERGAQVIVADNGAAKDGESPGPGPADEVVGAISAAGGKAVACTADLAEEDGAAQAIAACLESFGQIDGVAHFASTCPDLKTPDRLSTRDLDRVMRVNTYAGLWLARSAWPYMVKQGHGRLLFATSAGAYGAPGNADYSAAKAAQIGLTRCLAVDGTPHGILVNAVAPAATTRMTDGIIAPTHADWFTHTMTAERVAPGAAYLLSRECFCTGEVFAMGGGRIARIALAEAEGVSGAGATLEAARDLMPQVLADRHFFYPANLAERTAHVAGIFSRISSEAK